VVYPEEYGYLFLGTVVAHNKRRKGNNKICEFYFAFYSTAIAKKQRESNSGEESLKSLSRSEYKGEENEWLELWKSEENDEFREYEMQQPALQIMLALCSIS